MTERDSPSAKQTALASGLILLLTMACYRNVLFRPGLIIGGDSLGSFYHFLGFAARELEAGRMPWWCPHIHCGVPFVASLMAPIFHPVMALFMAFPIQVAYHLAIVLGSWVGGTFMMLYLRTMGLPRFPAFFGSLALIFSGWVVTDAPLYERELTFLHLPMVLFCLEKAIRTRRLTWYALVGAAVALQVHMTNVQLALYCDMYVACYWAARSGLMRKGALARQTLGGVLAVIVAAGLAAPLVLPTAAFLPETTRTDRTYEFAVRGSVPPEELAEFFMRNPFGSWRNTKHFVHLPGKRAPYYWGREGMGGHVKYLGALTCLLVAIGVGLSSRRRLRWFCVAVVVAAVGLALGRYAPFFRVVWSIVPGASMFRGPAKWSLIAVFPLSVLAALGAEVVLFSQCATVMRRMQRLLVVAISAAVLLASGGSLAWRTCRDSLVALFEIPSTEWLRAHSHELFRTEGWSEISAHVTRSLWATAAWSGGAALLLLVVIRARPRLARSPYLRAVALAAFTAYFLVDVWSLESEHLHNCPASSALLCKDGAVDTVQSRRLSRFLVFPATWRFIDNKAISFGIDCAHGYLPYRNQRVRDLMSQRDAKVASQVFDLTSVGLIVTQGPRPQGAGELVYYSGDDDRARPPFPLEPPGRDGWSIHRRPVSIWARAGALPRAFLVPNAVALSDEEFLRKLAKREVSLASEVVLNASRGPVPWDGLSYSAGAASRVRGTRGRPVSSDQDRALESPSHEILKPPEQSPLRSAVTPDPVEIVTFEPGERVFRVRSATRAFLVTSETYDRGWQATIDGEPLPVLRANYAFQAVRVPSGEHEVRLFYRPPWWREGLCFAAVGVLALVMAVVIDLRDWRRGRQ